MVADALYGIPDHVMYIPAAWQSMDPRVNIGGPLPVMLRIYPLLAYDSWLTIGSGRGDESRGLKSLGIDFSKWTATKALRVDDGAVFCKL